jgi:outer membrane protein assembly factor BamB
VGDYSSPFAFTGIIDEVRIYHGTLSDSEIREHFATPGRTGARDAELVLCMSFDEGDVTDESGNNNHGKLEGALPTAGQNGGAMQFTGYLKSWAGSPLRYRWSQKIPLLVRAMVLANKTLFIAGPPDLVDEEEAFDYSAEPDIAEQLRQQDAALDGQHGALLWAVSTSDGEKLAEFNLDSQPVFDGMIAANGRLYIATKDGRLLCLAGKYSP